jgi:thymidylate kinase
LFEREDYLAKVRDIFQGLQGEEFFHLDALRPMEEVADDVARIALDFLAFFVADN